MVALLLLSKMKSKMPFHSMIVATQATSIAKISGVFWVISATPKWMEKKSKIKSQVPIKIKIAFL
jgi:hypothetical protein